MGAAPNIPGYSPTTAAGAATTAGSAAPLTGGATDTFSQQFQGQGTPQGKGPVNVLTPPKTPLTPAQLKAVAAAQTAADKAKAAADKKATAADKAAAAKAAKDATAAAKAAATATPSSPDTTANTSTVQTDTTGQTTTSAQTNTAQTSKTSYVSYLDPATVQGTLADAYQRLMGRNPTPAEYQAFLTSVYHYEDQANSGKFESGVILRDNQKLDDKTGNVVDVKTGKPVAESDIQRVGTDTSTATNDTTTNKNIVSQRGLGTRGAQFLAGQSAMANPEEGGYQASTTYFNALLKSLSGPAAGMQASGPTNTAP